MTHPEDIETTDEFEGYEAPHGFEVDIHTVVLTNLKLVLAGIDQLETKETTDYVKQTHDDEENQQSFISWIQGEHDLLRTAAVHLALVGLVTRYHHWLITIANCLRAEKDKTFDKSAIQEMHFLNDHFKPSPHQPKDFTKWVTVRDCIIHADSKAAWEFEGKTRQLESQFEDAGELRFTEADLQDAFQKMLAAIGWYYSHYEDWYEAKHGPTVIVGGQRTASKPPDEPAL